MKQLLFLLLFPCLAMAQYQGNGNQKITLGEQTSADGLVWRGITSDTVNLMTNKIDTSAYLVLDTITEAIWLYRASTTPKWNRVVDSLNNLQGQLSLTTKVTGVLPVANGGTGIIAMPAGYILHGDGTSVDTSLGLFFNRSTSSLGVNTNNPAATVETIGELRINGAATGNGLGVFRLKGAKSNVNGFRFEFDNSNNTTQLINFYSGPMIFGNANAEDMRLSGAGELNIGYGATDNGAYPLQVNGQIFATNATIATSDEKFKENITPLTKGLEIVNKLKPVTFNFISDTENNFSEYEEVGFIAQDVDRALSTESFSKSIVKSADDSEPTSTMGLATQNLIPILVKAIQEQQALIKALEQRILTLENK